VKKEFKSLVLSFANGKKALMEIPPENYLIVTKYAMLVSTALVFAWAFSPVPCIWYVSKFV